MKFLERLKRIVKALSLSENIVNYINSGESLPSPFTAEEEAELNAKLTSLLQNTESPVPAQATNSGVLDMLEALAARLENRNRA